MGVKFEEGGATTERVTRFLRLVSLPQFTCPELGGSVLATPFGPVDFGTSPWISYNTAMVFLLVPSSTSQPFAQKFPPAQRTNGVTFYDPPAGYVPKINKVGNTSRKVYLADGARFYIGGAPPTMNLDINPTVGGAYSDPGAYTKFSRAWDRGRAPGNGGTGNDARVLIFRHGNSKPGGPADSYRINMGFYDGHVENMGDLEASNPVYWLPKGTSIAGINGELYPDVAKKYLNGVTGTYVCPQ
jgi:prepilin-type processing-associated H-X9-DG protein